MDNIMNDKNMDLLERSKQDLDALEGERAKGIMFRTKACWNVEAERNTKYFFNLEKLKSKSRTAFVLITEEGKTINTQKGILNEQKRFYEKLYSADKSVKFKIDNDSAPRLSEEEQRELDKPITKQEVADALKKMSKGKCPGQDGLSVDIMKFFFKWIGSPLFEALQEGIQEGKLHPTALMGIINLIPKTNNFLIERRLQSA